MQNTSKIGILVTDDHIMVRQGLIACLGDHENITIVGEAASGAEAIRKYPELKPDIVLMDITMPDMNGIEATRLLLSKYPKAKILILSAHKEPEYINIIARSGAMGYILKESSTDEIFLAIDYIQKGKKYFGAEVTSILVEGFGAPEQNQEQSDNTQLTSREKEILSLIGEGLISKEIADKLELSVKTISVHREHIINKLNIHTSAGLVRYAIENGLLKKKK